MQLLGISGSLRSGSHNTQLLAAAADRLPQGWTFAMPDLLRDVPAFDVDAEEPEPEAVERVRETVAAADAVLISTPEYNASIPGQLKNVLDWTSRPFATNVLRNRPVAVVSASTTPFGGIWAAAELRKVLSTIGARVVDGGPSVPTAHEAFDRDGRLLDADLDRALDEVVASLTAEVRASVAAG